MQKIFGQLAIISASAVLLCKRLLEKQQWPQVGQQAAKRLGQAAWIPWPGVVIAAPQHTARCALLDRSSRLSETQLQCQVYARRNRRKHFDSSTGKGSQIEQSRSRKEIVTYAGSMRRCWIRARRAAYRMRAHSWRNLLSEELQGGQPDLNMECGQAAPIETRK
eukprot:366532-Chlamydomonas_euryale.AAC.7